VAALASSPPFPPQSFRFPSLFLSSYRRPVPCALSTCRSSLPPSSLVKTLHHLSFIVAMLSSTLISLVTLALVGPSVAAPLLKPFPIRRMESGELAHAERDLAPEGMINLYECQSADCRRTVSSKSNSRLYKKGDVGKKRLMSDADAGIGHDGGQDKRQFSDSQPAMAPNGQIKPFANGGVGKRQFPDSQPAMAPNGEIKPFANGGTGKRQFPDTQPAMAPNGDIVPFANGGTGKRLLSDAEPADGTLGGTFGNTYY